jgi:hypothetical protein
VGLLVVVRIARRTLGAHAKASRCQLPGVQGTTGAGQKQATASSSRTNLAILGRARGTFRIPHRAQALGFHNPSLFTPCIMSSASALANHFRCSLVTDTMSPVEW